MNILDLINRDNAPRPWAQGDNIPWNEPGFSERMLNEHLSQAHDMASRRLEIIDSHVQWIDQSLLNGKQSKILDLGCGPGFYCSRLAKLRHQTLGIDFSPASINHASQQAESEKLNCQYIHADLRHADFASGFDLAMLIYGELNVFKHDDIKTILTKANNALNDNGVLLLEPHSFEAIKAIGSQPASWYSAKTGLFSETPHICLDENFWDDKSQTATKRFYIIDASTGDVTQHGASYQAYTDQQYTDLFKEAGFDQIRFYPKLAKDNGKAQSDLIAITAKKK